MAVAVRLSLRYYSGMDRTNITYEEVARAARALIQEGKRVTAAAIRERLGRGSMTTIQRHLKTWREKEAPVEAVEKSEALQKLLKRLREELEPSKQVAEQAASLYRAFLGPETERILRNLAREFERSQRELERIWTSLLQLQDKGVQKFLETLRQDQERLRKAVLTPAMQRALEGLKRDQERWQKLVQDLDLQTLAKQTRRGQEQVKELRERLRDTGPALRAPEPALAPPTESTDLEELARRLRVLEQRLERLEREPPKEGRPK